MQHSTDFGCSANLASGLRPAVSPRPADGSRCVPKMPYPHDPAGMPPPVCWCLPAADRLRRNAAGCAGGNRQLQNVELDLQDSLTVLAGPNNSGKTTLISVLKGMFYDKKLRFNYSDIPTNLSTAWLDKILPVFQTIMTKHDKETGIREIVKQISSNEAFAANYVMESFQAQIQVDYDPVSDDIQCFADYLMDLDENKHSFYFLYTYEPSISSFEKVLNSGLKGKAG